MGSNHRNSSIFLNSICRRECPNGCGHRTAILRWDKLIGSIEQGKLADFLVIEGTTGNPYGALIAATESSIKLVMIHSVPQYGSAKLMAKLGADTPGEPIKVASSNQILHLTSNDP